MLIGHSSFRQSRYKVICVWLIILLTDYYSIGEKNYWLPWKTQISIQCMISVLCLISFLRKEIGTKTETDSADEVKTELEVERLLKEEQKNSKK